LLYKIEFGRQKKIRIMPLSVYTKQKVKYAVGAAATLLFITGVIMTIIGVVIGAPIVFGVGLGIAVIIAATGIGVRERNLAGY
jgi:hypothetical protein